MGYIHTKRGEARKHIFYQVPKILFDGQYKSLSNNARMLYALLRDRASLSEENGWYDENDYIYFLYSRANLAKDLGISERTVIDCIKKLNDLKLIREECQGFGKANRIYLCEIQPIEILPDNIIRGEEIAPGGEKIAPREVKKLHPNNTNTNNTNISKSNNDKSLLGASAKHGQKTLLDIPQPKKEKPKKRLTHKEQSEIKIASAKNKQISWEEVTDRDFTYYFIEQHNKQMKKPISFDRFSSVGIIRDNLIRAYDIQRHEVCSYIDKLLEIYSGNPNAWDSLTFNMIQKNVPMMKELMMKVQFALDDQKPVEQSQGLDEWEWKMSNLDKLKADEVF